jgi:hypothetical protein
MEEILTQHRKTYTFETSKGKIELKHLGFVQHQRIFREICQECPDYEKAQAGLVEFREWFDELKKMKPEDRAEAKLSETQQARLDWAMNITSKYLERYYPPCFVKPVIHTMEELDAMLTMLDPLEAHMIYDALIAMAAPRNVDETMKAIARILTDSGIKLPPEIDISNMTIQQGQLINLGKQEELEAAQRLIGELK